MSEADPAAMFLALVPDAELWATIDAYKSDTRRLVGDQLYLGDPPHQTVFLSVFPDVDTVASRWTTIYQGITAPAVKIIGWKVFEADPLTGHTTLAFDISDRDKTRLRAIQQQLIDRVSGWRDPGSTRARYEPRLARLSPQQRRNVEQSGFPYIGSGFEPHFTVASIRPSDWPRVWDALHTRPPDGDFTCPSLALYRLDGLKPLLVRSSVLPVA